MNVTRRATALGGLGLLTGAAVPPTSALAEGLRLFEGMEDFWIASEAYIFGYPLVTMEMTRRVITNVAAPTGQHGAPILLGQGGAPARFDVIPRVTFTDPEIGAVGLTEAQAREQLGGAVATATVDLADTTRGWLHGPGTSGLVKVVEDADRGVLVGATVLAPYGGEVIGLLVTAVHGEVPVARLRTMHYAYPTFHRTIEAALARLA